MSTGLPNYGNTCYINSILQCLRYQRHFVKQLAVYESTNDLKIHQEFIDLLFAGCSDETLRKFITSLSKANDEFELWKQCDAHELYMFLISSFYEKHKMKNHFEGELLQSITCKKCKYNSETKQKFISLSLSITSEKSPESLIEDFEKEENVLYKCEKCDHTTCIKKMKIDIYPNILVLHLKRFDGINKISTPVVLKNPNTYRLTAICNHSGTTDSGHYTAAVKKTNQGWLIISDSDIQSLSKIPEKSIYPYILFFERYKRKRI